MDRNVVRRLAPTPAPLRLSGTALSTEKLLEEKLDGDHIVIVTAVEPRGQGDSWLSWW